MTALRIASGTALSNAVPLGYGHRYAPARDVDASVTLTDPDVTRADIARPKAHVQP